MAGDGTRLTWHPERLQQELAARTERGMEKAVTFAADQARGYAPERTGRLKRGIAGVVERRGTEVTGKVGHRKGKGQNAAPHGHLVELGTVKMAAQPHLRPAVFNHGAEITRLVAGG